MLTYAEVIYKPPTKLVAILFISLKGLNYMEDINCAEDNSR